MAALEAELAEEAAVAERHRDVMGNRVEQAQVACAETAPVVAGSPTTTVPSRRWSDRRCGGQQCQRTDAVVELADE
ncbi:MAG: hypothetical protein ACYC1D_07090 [Acidimicrobiales bacterium]